MRFSRLAGAALAGAVTFGVAVPAQSATTPGWRQVLSKHYGAAADFSDYGTVLALARNNAWALGGYIASNGTPSEATAEHWNGRTWSAVAMPAGAAADVGAASAATASSIWAESDNGYILRWNGSKWSIAKHLTGFGELTGVTAISPTNVWVFGGPGGDPGFGTYHYNGKTWQSVTAAGKLGLENGSALSATSIWAIGSLNAPYNAIYHYNGTAWQHVTATALSGLQLWAIKAYSPANIWATGNVGGDATSPAVMVHFNGKAWTRYAVPWNFQVGRFASDGQGGFWLTGYQYSATGIGTGWLLHRTSAGKWSRVSPGGSLTDVALTPGTASLWGTGSETGKTGSNAVILADGTLP
jgi:hypothetical protein